MVDDPTRTFLGRRYAAAGLTAASASFFVAHGLGASPMGAVSIAAGLVLLAAAFGFARRSLTGQVLARAAAWLAFVPAALHTVARPLTGHLPHASGALLALATGAALLLARPMLHAGAGVFSPARFRSSFLAGATTASIGAIAAALFAFQGFRMESGLMFGFNAALSMLLLASVIGVLRMRTWGVLLGATTSVGLLALTPFYGSVNAITLSLAATPALLFWVLPLVVGRRAASATPEPVRVRISGAAPAAEAAAELLDEADEPPRRTYAPRALPAP